MIRLLEWDSDLFQMKVGSADVRYVDEISTSELELFDLVYIFSKEDTEGLPSNFFLADKKVTYQKIINERYIQKDHMICSVDANEGDDTNLIELALQAGEYSRFNLDKRFPKGSFQTLYKSWVINSLNRKIANEVYVLNGLNGYEGMVTLGIKNGIPDIGLIAVDKKYRGKGIGGKLISAAENWAVNVLNTNQIQVVTQGFNLPACSFYEKHGFDKVSRIFIYHWWSPNLI